MGTKLCGSCKAPLISYVIFIHGTFSNSSSDEGKAWWQRGSEVWNAFAHRLRDTPIELQSRTLFHWSGYNSESERWKAAEKLLSEMVLLEQKKQPYHLVGHSHGGSIIWLALKLSLLESALKKVKASNLNQIQESGLLFLQSWTTVGTPFLIQQASQRLLLSIGQLFIGFSSLLIGMLSFFLLLYTAIDCLINGFGTNGAQSILDIFFVMVIGLVFGVSFSAAPIEALMVKNEKSITIKALSLYGNRWLGLWSPEDEAINGLRATLGLGGKVVPRRRDKELAFRSGELRSLVRPFYRLLNLSYNLLIPPIADRFFWSSFARNLHGNDRPGTKIVQVSTGPTESLGNIPPLPSTLCESLLNSANDAMRRKVPVIRYMLNQVSYANPVNDALNKANPQLTGEELIHTSYFLNEDVREIICLNIELSSESEKIFDNNKKESQIYRTWLMTMKKLVNDAIAERTKSFL